MVVIVAIMCVALNRGGNRKSLGLKVNWIADIFLFLGKTASSRKQVKGFCICLSTTEQV